MPRGIDRSSFPQKEADCFGKRIALFAFTSKMKIVTILSIDSVPHTILADRSTALHFDMYIDDSRYTPCHDPAKARVIAGAH